MGFPAPIYFWISVSPTPPSSNNRLVSWHDGEYATLFRKANKHPRGQTTNVAKDRATIRSISGMLFPFVRNFLPSVFIRATGRLTGSSFWNPSFLDVCDKLNVWFMLFEEYATTSLL